MRYGKRPTYIQMRPHIQELLSYLRENCPVLQEYKEGDREVFLLLPQEHRDFMLRFNRIYPALKAGGFLELIPWDSEASVLVFDPAAQGRINTITPTHMRLPRLGHLITLTSGDFRDFFVLVANAKNVSNCTSLTLNPPLINYPTIEATPFNHFFEKLITNYRFDLRYVSANWTPRSLIKYIAAHQISQLEALQLLAVAQDSSITQIPAETTINLELEWPQVADEYCRPQQI